MLRKSLQSLRSPLAAATRQLELLEQAPSLPSFRAKLDEAGLAPLRPDRLEIFQVNVGKMCNQVCNHCHVDAGPDRKEIMTKDTMQQCLDVLKDTDTGIVDITGGAPEMNPSFRWFVEALRALGKHVMVRSNLTIIVANKKYNDLPEFYRDHQVEVVSSLPFYKSDRTDRQRGEGVFRDSIAALHLLNKAGYGLPESGLLLHLVYNPAGAFLPTDQSQMEKDFKAELAAAHGISFNRLYCITNMPVSRYLEYLIKSGNYTRYMERLVNAFNPLAARNVMCRNTLSVGWDGTFYDCDFNQMLELRVATSADHISRFNQQALRRREIRTGQHCYGCTAGTGSSCGGATT